MMSGTQRTNTSALLKSFKDKLAEWKSTSECGLIYHDVVALRQWLEQTQQGNTKSNAAVLLEDHQKLIGQDRLVPYDHTHFFNKDRCCLIVFAILMHLDHGELIDIFRDVDIVDDQLRLLTEVNYSNLEKRLNGVRSTNPQIRPKGIIEQFKRVLWSFCPASINHHMEGYYYSTNIILPYCRKQKVNIKGGTASVYEVLVQEAFLDKHIQTALAAASVQDQEYGKVFNRIKPSRHG